MAPDIPSFDDLIDLLRERLGIADNVNPSESHSFKELMKDEADGIPEHWYHQAFDEPDAQGHLDHGASSKVMGDAVGRLSANGRLQLRSSTES